MRRAPRFPLLAALIAGVLGTWPGVGRTHRALELDPPRPGAAAKKAMRDLVMRPSRMKRDSLESFFANDTLATRRDRLRLRLAPQRPRSQREALRTAETSGFTADRRPPSESNPVMNAFAALVAEHQRAAPGALTGVHVIALQHLLGSTGGLLRGLAQLGARPEDILALGKTYSQSEPVIQDLDRAGFRVRPARHESELDLRVNVDSYPSHGGAQAWGSRASFELAGGGMFGGPARPGHDRKAELDQRIEELVAQIAKQDRLGKKSRVLVIDDGGDLIERIHHEHPDLHDRIVAVEQTRRGIRKVQKLELRFPVVDVAQASAKLTHESPMIGLSIARTTIARILRIEESGQVLPRRILAIGHGAVGAAANEALRRAGFEVQVYDRSPAVRRQARRAGFRVYEQLDEALAHGDIVLSMTGETVLDGAALAKLPSGAVLINGASSATELMPDKLHLMRGLVMNSVEMGAHSADAFAYYRGRRFKMGTLARSDVDGNSPSKGMDWPVQVPSESAPQDRKQDKQLLWVNQGEVVNFDRSIDPIPPRYIQLTRGLLFLGAVQALKTAQPGIHALAREPQEAWVKAVNADLARTGESLERPVF